MAGRVSQEVVEAVYTGSPKARVSQEVVEAVYAGSPKGRVSQEVVEVVYVESAAPSGFARSFAVIVG